IGRDLGKGGEDALAELDLARTDADDPWRVEGNPAAQLGIVLEALRKHVVHAHASPPRRAAARSTARRMLPCAPQRHRCLSSAARIVARPGRRSVLNNAW